MSDAVSCAEQVVAQLRAQGVTEVVLCPGSRSAPLAFAVAARRDLRVHVRVDERSAGFLALGLAKASGTPVAVMTTSGTAVGNLLPAVMEAHHAHVPLVVVSADRPAALVGTGANQTTEQAGMFGAFVRLAVRLGDHAPASAVRAQVVRLVAAAQGTRTRRPGPVQLNLELVEPLTPAGEAVAPLVAPVEIAASGPGAPVVLVAGPRTVVVAGDAPIETGRRLAASARAAGLPLIAEPSSNARGSFALVNGSALLGTSLAAEIERVVVFGHPTLTRPVTRLLARADVEVVVAGASADWPDPGWRAGTVADEVLLSDGDPRWLAAWRDADRRLDAALVADDAAAGGRRLSGRRLVRAVLAAGADSPLVLGASALIRDAGTIGWPDSLAVYANRGLSGIDGTVSTAVGVGLATGRPTTLLCGDLTFLHDLNGLAIGPGEPRPDLRIVVGDDRGGSIFATLETGDDRHAAVFDRFFTTPSGVDLAAAAAGYGVPARRVGDAAGVAAALAEPIRGVSVLVVDLDRGGRRADGQRLALLAGEAVQPVQPAP